MRSLAFILLFLTATQSISDFNSKTANFNIELLYQCLQNTTNMQDIISPFSIWSLLVSIAHETSDDTWKEISQALRLTNNRSESVANVQDMMKSAFVKTGVNVTSRNFLFYDEALHMHAESIKRLEDDFGFITERLNFTNPEQANELWNQIMQQHLMPLEKLKKVILSPYDFEESVMIMLNYLEFKAKWANPFVIDFMKPVYNKFGNKIGNMTMMSAKGRFRISNFESLKATVTEVPYEGREYCMLVIRPNSEFDSITLLLRNLRKMQLNDIFSKLQSDEDEFGWKELKVKLPAFSDETMITLDDHLHKMGLSNVFDKRYANFDNFCNDKIYVTEIRQHVSIVVNAQETNIFSTIPTYGFMGSAWKSTFTKVNAYDNFVYLIVAKSTATVLFGGVYSIPTELDFHK